MEVFAFFLFVEAKATVKKSNRLTDIKLRDMLESIM